MYDPLLTYVMKIYINHFMVTQVLDEKGNIKSTFEAKNMNENTKQKN